MKNDPGGCIVLQSALNAIYTLTARIANNINLIGPRFDIFPINFRFFFARDVFAKQQRVGAD